MKKIILALIFLMVGFASFASSHKIINHTNRNININKVKSISKIHSKADEPIAYGIFLLSCGISVQVSSNVFISTESMLIMYDALDTVYCG